MAHLGNTVVNGALRVLGGENVDTINGVTVGSSPKFTDANVTQTATTTDANYEVLFSATADNTTRTEGARKTTTLRFNPSKGSLMEGDSTVASGTDSHAEGYNTIASGHSSHAEGYKTSATYARAHAEGESTLASGDDTHAEGVLTVASGSYSHAEGYYASATGSTSHAEGLRSIASANYSHAEGLDTTASGIKSHAEGSASSASGEASHAGGSSTIAAGNFQTAIGKYNIADTTSAFIIGNGSSSARSNALKIDWDGNFYTNKLMLVGKGSSRSTSTVGTWTAMCNSSQTGSPTCPTSGKWWNIINLNNWLDSSANWVSQLAVATQGDPSAGVWYRHNDSANTDISSSTWKRLAEADANGYAKNAIKVNGLTVETAVPANAVFTDHTYNFSGTTFASGNSSTGEHNADNITYNGHFYYTSNGPSTDLGAQSTDGALYSQAYSASWVGQIAQDYRNGNLFVRGKNNGTWTNWYNIFKGCKWKATVTANTWSRICYVTPRYITEGSSAILTVNGYRGSYVTNNTFILNIQHSGPDYSNIKQINSGNYSIFAYRAVIDVNGNYYFEIKDTANQAYHCSILVLDQAEIVTYINCPSGASIPSGFSATNGDYGYTTTHAVGNSHAEGDNTTAGALTTHAGGYQSRATASRSFAHGSTAESSNYAAAAFGKSNAAMTTGGTAGNTTGTAFVIGNGTSGFVIRSNAFSVQYDGTVKAKSTITASTTADYAEFFEWADENPNNEDRVGYFITFDTGDKIRIATPNDNYILGISSGEPFVLGNGDCDVWNGMYLRDKFRRTMYEPAPLIDEKTGEEIKDKDDKTVYQGTRPILNPDYDPSQPYISRMDRPEWCPVGMLGVLAVRDDGTCEVNGYATINNNGIATKATASSVHKYRVIKRNDIDVVEVVFR